MRMMKLRFFIISCMLSTSASNNQNKFLTEYFLFKNVSYVVGFHCSHIQEKLILSKRLNIFGIRSSLTHLNSNSNVFLLIGSKYTKIGVFIDSRCFNEGELHALLMKASNWRLYGEMHSWLVFSNGNLSETVAQLDESGFGLSTDFVIAVPTISGYDLFDVYNPWKGGGCNVNVTRMGFWNESFNLHITLTQSKFRRRCDLHGITMKANFFRSNYKPKNVAIDVYLQDYSTLYKDGLSKFGYNLLMHLSQMFNFTLRFGEIKKWYPGDSLGPMSRGLVENEIQITGSPVIITEERLNLTKFVYPAWPFRTCFIFRNPQKRDIKIGEILQPFTCQSWYATLFTMATIFTVLALSFVKENHARSENVLFDAFLTIVGSMCQQSTTIDLKRISTRIVFFNLLILSFLIYNFYNAVVVSTRLSEPLLKINDSLNELGKLEFKMATEPMNYFEFIFSQLKKWEHKVFYEDRWLKIPESERFMFPEKAVSLVKKGGFAYHTHPDVSYPIIAKTFSYREICELMEVHPAPLRYSTLSVAYNSTFVEMAKIGLSRMTEVGIRKRQILRYTSRKPTCLRDLMDIESTDIYDFTPHLMLLAVGMLMSGFIIMFELIYANCWKDPVLYDSMYYGSSESHMISMDPFVMILN